jgi:hypothetical protein
MLSQIIGTAMEIYLFFAGKVAFFPNICLYRQNGRINVQLLTVPHQKPTVKYIDHPARGKR